MRFFGWFRKKEKKENFPSCRDYLEQSLLSEYPGHIIAVKLQDLSSKIPRKKKRRSQRHFSGEVGNFLKERCHFTFESGFLDHVSVAKLYIEYCKWKESRDTPAISLSGFGRELSFCLKNKKIERYRLRGPKGSGIHMINLMGLKK